MARSDRARSHMERSDMEAEALGTLVILAILIVPVFLRLLYPLWKERFQDHRRLARRAFPAFLYVSITGFVVYVLLYHVNGCVQVYQYV